MFGHISQSLNIQKKEDENVSLDEESKYIRYRTKKNEDENVSLNEKM